MNVLFLGKKSRGFISLHLPWVALFLLVFVGGCIQLPATGSLIPVNGEARGAKRVNVLVGTTRRYTSSEEDFSATRSFKTGYQFLEISIPPTHIPGQIEFPRRVPGDPRTSFVTRRNVLLSRDEFKTAVERNLLDNGEVVVYIHGFNTSHARAVFTLAQVISDGQFTALPIAFTWPSSGKITDYLKDRDSALFSRRALTKFLSDLSAIPNVKRISVVGHSMGAFLTSEMLMLASLSGKGNFNGKLGYIVLTSGDVDVDVFTTEWTAVSRQQPGLIVFSKDDKALLLSGKLFGGNRLGRANPGKPPLSQLVKDYKLSVLDLSGLPASEATAFNHNKLSTSPVVLRQLGQVFANSNIRNKADKNPGFFFVNAVGKILSAPGEIFSRVFTPFMQR